MTCIVVLRIAKKFGINLEKHIFVCTETASEIEGTSAKLDGGDRLTLQ